LKQRMRKGKHGILVTILRYVNVLIPIAIGYGLADVSEKYWLVIACIVALATTFFLQVRLEDNR